MIFTDVSFNNIGFIRFHSMYDWIYLLPASLCKASNHYCTESKANYYILFTIVQKVRQIITFCSIFSINNVKWQDLFCCARLKKSSQWVSSFWNYITFCVLWLLQKWFTLLIKQTRVASTDDWWTAGGQGTLNFT